MKNILKFDDDQIKQVEDQADKEEPNDKEQEDNRVSEE